MNVSRASSKAKAAAQSVAPSTPTRTERFHLDGPSRLFDPRTHAVRRDIADVALAGTIFAPHYAQPQPRGCILPSAMIHAAADESSEALSQLIRGEGFAMLDVARGWAWGYCLHDHYVGFIPAEALGEPEACSHIVTTALALVFAEPDFKAAVIDHWPLGARFSGEESGGFIACEQGYVHRLHAAPLGTIEDDPVAIAERFLGAPYLWGGRGDRGIDCSGLIQVALGRCGIAAPRDTDQQLAAELGAPIAPDAALQRGDLIFFPSHVGLMVDSERLIHANSHSMAVTIEPLDNVTARIRPNHDRPILDRRRLKP